MTREQFLTELKDAIAERIFKPHGYEVPQNIRVSCGWPSRGGLSKNRSMGECWDVKASKAGVFEIFVSPFIDDRGEAAECLVHELIHVVVGVEERHGTAFKRACKRIGLMGRATQTYATPNLKKYLAEIVDKFPAYEHASIDKEAVERKKQTTRMIKLQCKCGYTLRTTLKWVKIGIPVCYCEHPFEVINEDKTNG